MHRLAKGVLSPVLPEDPGVTLTSPLEVAFTRGRKKTNSTKREKSHWEHVSIAHRKIQKSSGSGSGSGYGFESWLGSGSGSRSCGRGRPPRAPKGRGRGRNRGQCSLSSVIYMHLCVPNSLIQTLSLLSFILSLAIGRIRMLYELEHSTNVYLNLVGIAERVNGLIHRIRWQDGPRPYEHWLVFTLCMISVQYLLYTFNGFIIVPNESTIGQIHIGRGFHIGMRGLLEIESK
ncbi:hypothetical protein M9H77_31822 [Catharanthus roseus]|uniref:Uncharacterized protein n=1 Tax=Catharanthus roseus TaxID=4058 RepID=A0ACC0A307_CATRO|nr:hypothetical protein M9H77_31822 [Catharanthus roseus]